MDKKYTKKLLSYSAVAGAFVAAGQTADAQVVYTDIDPDTTISAFTGNPILDIDMDNNGSVDFQIRHYFFSTSYYSTTSTSTGTWYYWGYMAGNIFKYAPGAEVFGNNSYVVDTLPFDEELVNSDPFNVNNNNYNFGSFYFGSWGSTYWGPLPGAGERFLGVRFLNGSDTLYGWIRVSMPLNSNEVTIHGYAYETQAGVGIHAGDTVGVYIGALAPSNIMVTSAQIDYTPMKGGNVYCVVQDYADPMPTAAEVISGAGAPTANVVFADTNFAVAETADNFAITSLTQFTQYKAYLVLVDDSNIVSHVIDTAFTTLDPTGIDYNGISEFNVFPNPVVQNLNLELPESSVVIIRDLSGREILRSEFTAGRHIIDLSAIEAGTYLIEAVGDRTQKTIKFFKR